MIQNVIPIAIVVIVNLLTLGGIGAYAITVTGNRLDLSQKEIEEIKAGVKRYGLWDYLRRGIVNTLLLFLAWLLVQLAVEPLDFRIFYLIMGSILGIVNLYISFYRMELLALERELSLIFRYKVAFATLGIINLGMAVTNYLIR